MAIRFDCPNCKANYDVVEDLAGKMIMCRVCKKRGPVRSAAPAASPASLSAAGLSSSSSMSRRNFLPFAGLFVASLGAIGVGALLARQPWNVGKESPEERGFRGRPPGEDKKDDKKDNKGSAV